MMERRGQKAVEKFVNGYNCSQAVLSAYCDLFGLDETTAFKLSESFGLGMGMKKECGALIGMLMVGGLASSDGNLGQGTSKQDTYKVARAFSEAFEEEMGTTLCGELLKKEREMKEAASQEELDATNGKNLICTKCVKMAGELLDEYLEGKE